MEIQDEALKEYKEGLTVFNTNLAYGDESHLFNYIGQSVKGGQVPKLILDSTFKFHPVHNKDTGIEVMCEGEQWGSSSKRYSLSGVEEMTLRDIVNKFEKFYGKGVDSTKVVDIPLSPTEVNFEQNMLHLVDYLEKNQDQGKWLHENSYFTRMGSQPKQRIDNYLENVAKEIFGSTPQISDF